MTGCLLGESYDDKGQVIRKVFPCHDVIKKRSPPVLAMWWICEYDKGNWYDVAISFCARKMRTSDNQCSSAWRMQISWRKYAQGPEQPPLWSNHDGCTINLVTQHRSTFYILHQQYMMTSSNGNFFRVTGLLCGNSPVTIEFPSQSQWRGALIFSLICAWINRWVNNREAGDMRRHRGHFDVIVMSQENMGQQTIKF